MPILIPSPVQCSPFVVGRCTRSGRCFASREVLEKSAPKPPEAMITGPCSWNSWPLFRYLHPTTVSPLGVVSSSNTSALFIIRTIVERSAIFSTIWINAYVMVIPGKRSFPRCVRGWEWPPRRDTKERSRSKASISHSTSGPLFAQRTFATSGFFAPPFKVSPMKISAVSWIPFCFWLRVPAPLIPLVAFVEFPPQKEDLSRRTHLPPHSITVLHADMPPRPPPTTMACPLGKTHAMLLVGRGRPAGLRRGEKPGRALLRAWG